MGKDFQLRYARLYVDGCDLSGDSRTLSTLENSYGEADVSGWAEHYNYIRDGVLTAGITGYQALLNDAAGRAFTKLKGADSHDLAMLLGNGGAPAIGALAYLMKAQQLGDLAMFDAKVGMLQADFKPLVGYPFAPFGRALAVGAEITAPPHTPVWTTVRLQRTAGRSSCTYWRQIPAITPSRSRTAPTVPTGLI
jgi:hypothetical protein